MKMKMKMQSKVPMNYGTTTHEFGKYRTPVNEHERSTLAPDIAVNHRAPGHHYHEEKQNFSQNYPKAALSETGAPKKISGGYHAPLSEAKSHGYHHQSRDGHLRDSTLGKGHRIGKK